MTAVSLALTAALASIAAAADDLHQSGHVRPDGAHALGRLRVAIEQAQAAAAQAPEGGAAEVTADGAPELLAAVAALAGQVQVIGARVDALAEAAGV